MRNIVRHSTAILVALCAWLNSPAHEIRVQSSVCGVTQTYTVDDGATLTVLATPEPGSHFVQWEDGSSANPRTLTVTYDMTITATFAANGGGTLPTKKTIQFYGGECGTPLVGEFITGTILTLNATPITGYRFKRWSDGNTNNPRTVLVIENASYTAEFETYSSPTSYTPRDITVQVIGCTNPLEVQLPQGSELTLIAQPTDPVDDRFVQWENSNTNATRVETVTANATYTAEFGKTHYTITFVNHDGTVLQRNEVNYGETPVYSGIAPTKTATTQYVYTFKGWTPAITAAMEDVTYTAEYTSVNTKALPGTFTVGSNRKVSFSPGNLQYKASTNTWRFAEHQYDYQGNKNASISTTYSDWIDLFGFGTSGWNSGISGVTSYAPTSTSTSASTYINTSLYGSGARADWGKYNAISNGGNVANLWRVLSHSEWYYLMYSRANAEKLYSRARVNSIDGIIFLPDNWKLPSGIPFTPKASSYLVNAYSEADWAKMEKAGAVFLPAAGWRYGTTYNAQSSSAHGRRGCYYTSTAYTSGSNIYARFLTFHNDIAPAFDGTARPSALSVRLVREVPSFTITFVDAEGNTIGEPQVIAAGNNALAPDPPTRTNYTFIGWIGRYQNVQADATIYASYRKRDPNPPTVFTVSDTKTVTFSQGNLQYHATVGVHQTADASTVHGVWRFAEHQYDTIGAGNANVASAYAGWIDLFGWGTSGWNSGANAYQPYATSTNNADYFPGGSNANELTGAYANADWGVYNAIFNGGDKPEEWRSLTQSELNYVFNTRTDAANKRSLATVNGVTGCILLPDNWVLPSGLSFSPTTANFTTNTYTIAQWQKMEANGAIFIPSAGYRNGTAAKSVNQMGDYWTSSNYTSDYNKAKRLLFREYGNGIDASLGCREDRHYGFGVRLVKDIVRYTITFDANGGIIPSDGNMGITPSGHVTSLSADQTHGTVVVTRGYNYFNEMYDDVPTREGYIFEGWFDSAGEQVYDNTGYSTIGTYWDEDRRWYGPSDVTVYARWRLDPMPDQLPGTLPGTFSVTPTTKVFFAQGNLQYNAYRNKSHACADGTTKPGYWRFAEHQYDYVGEGNENASETYYRWIDMFGWGTSGWNNGSLNYQPYNRDKDHANYLNAPLRGAYRFADWAVYNAIINGGNQPDLWRCPTIKEWHYLFYQRPNASSLYGAGRVDTINGLILLPDHWHLPAGLTFTPSIVHYTDNIYTKEQWAQMEANGAVFLPAAGYFSRDASGLMKAQIGCWYVSSDTIIGKPEKEHTSALIRFTEDSLNLYCTHRYATGRTVRPIREAPKFTIRFVDVENKQIGSAQTVIYGDDAVPPTPPVRTGYTFAGWIGLWQNVKADATIYASYYHTPAESGTQIGALDGWFPISDSVEVHFAQGNLQYNAIVGAHTCIDASTKQGVWRLGEMQYDTISYTNNKQASATWSNWIDQYGFGTSGWQIDAVAYEPYDQSMNNTDYIHHSLVGAYANADWGVYNAIFNGGNSAGLWRTPTAEELNYLVVLCKQEGRLGIACINHAYCGLVFLPVGFVVPSGLTFNAQLRGSDSMGLIEAFESINSYTAAQWAQMEANGAVFIQLKNRKQYPPTYADRWVLYQTSTDGDEDMNYVLSSDAGTSCSVNPYNKDKKQGYNIRLISQQMRVRTYEITALSDDNTMGEVEGGGIYNYGTFVHLTATPHSYYRFTQWSDGNTDNPRTVKVTGNATYTAEFEAEPKITIRFVDAENNQIGSAQSIYHGEDAVPPTPPVREGYTFVGWIGQWQNVQADATIYASYYKNSEASIVQPGALDGVFSVSPTEKVLFSQGNLHYHAMAGTHVCADASEQKGVWRFAEHQYDTLGVAQQQKAENYAGWVSAFAWGTSGWNSGANIYQPWAVSGDNYYDYYPGGDYTNDLTGAYENADWGVYNAIFNGGNLPRKWRTLSKDEWQYILKDRPNAEQLCSFVRVKNIRGMILLPDDFVLPDGVSFTPGETEANTNYSESEWLLLEQNGAVFLPVDMLYTFSLGHDGWGNANCYYTSTHGGNSEEKHAYIVYIKTLSLNTGRYRCDGGQVRVACAVPPTYTITVQPDDVNAGTTSGSGSFYEGSIKQISATPNGCYRFTQWSDGNTDNPRTITVTGDATYTAEFEKIQYTIQAVSDNELQGTVTITQP